MRERVIAKLMTGRNDALQYVCLRPTRLSNDVERGLDAPAVQYPHHFVGMSCGCLIEGACDDLLGGVDPGHQIAKQLKRARLAQLEDREPDEQQQKREPEGEVREASPMWCTEGQVHSPPFYKGDRVYKGDCGGAYRL